MTSDFIQAPASPNVGDSLQRAWTAFKPNIWLFLGFTLLFVISYYAAMFLFMLIPFGNLLVQLLGFIYPVSLYTAFQAADGGREIQFGAFFDWTPKFGRLFLGSLIVYAILLAMLIPVGLIFGVSLLNSGFSQYYAAGDIGRFWNIWFGFMAVALPLGILYGVVTFPLNYLLLKRDLPVDKTLAMSVRTGLQNIGQVLLYFLLAIGLFILGLVVCGLGLLITIPLLMGVKYFMLNTIFPDTTTENEWDFETPASPDKPYQNY